MAGRHLARRGVHDRVCRNAIGLRAMFLGQFFHRRRLAKPLLALRGTPAAAADEASFGQLGRQLRQDRGQTIFLEFAQGFRFRDTFQNAVARLPCIGTSSTLYSIVLQSSSH